MKIKLFCITWLLLASLHVIAGAFPRIVKDFSAWISDVEYDSTNDCYVVCYRPTAKMYASVYIGRSLEAQKVQPGESYVLNRGKEATITQHAHAWCSLAFTNGVRELDGAPLTAEFNDSKRQLIIQGRYAVNRDAFEKYAFVVNADGEAYDVGTKTKFHFGLPFHAPKVSPKVDPRVERTQRSFLEEGVETYKKAVSEPSVFAMGNYVKEDATNAVAFVWEMGGAGNLSEKDRSYLLKRDSEAVRLLDMLDGNRRKDCCVAFCSKYGGQMRIIAVARVFNRKEWHFWTYSRSGAPEYVFLGDGRGTAENYYEYGEDGLFRNFCLVSKFGINFHTIKDGVLQKSSDMDKAQEFISKVEEMFNKYVELDTTGTLKPFVERLKAQAEEAKTHQEAK